MFLECMCVRAWCVCVCLCLLSFLILVLPRATSCRCPHLTSELVVAFVTGLQNTTAQSTAPLLTAACCKHFAAYNLESNPASRFVFNAVVNDRDLWETYLPVFEACVERGLAQSVMCSYNSLNGIPTCVQ